MSDSIFSSSSVPKCYSVHCTSLSTSSIVASIANEALIHVCSKHSEEWKSLCHDTCSLCFKQSYFSYDLGSNHFKLCSDHNMDYGQICNEYEALWIKQGLMCQALDLSTVLNLVHPSKQHLLSGLSNKNWMTLASVWEWYALTEHHVSTLSDFSDASGILTSSFLGEKEDLAHDLKVGSLVYHLAKKVRTWTCTDSNTGDAIVSSVFKPKKVFYTSIPSLRNKKCNIDIPKDLDSFLKKPLESGPRCNLSDIMFYLPFIVDMTPFAFFSLACKAFDDHDYNGDTTSFDYLKLVIDRGVSLYNST